MAGWPSGLRRWIKAPVRKGESSNLSPVNISFFRISSLKISLLFAALIIALHFQFWLLFLLIFVSLPEEKKKTKQINLDKNTWC
jgi:hypothetical protein